LGKGGGVELECIVALCERLTPIGRAVKRNSLVVGDEATKLATITESGEEVDLRLGIGAATIFERGGFESCNLLLEWSDDSVGLAAGHLSYRSGGNGI
jgi:hypothetical protein